MRLLPKSWTHRKNHRLHDSGDWLCYCGHARFEHMSFSNYCTVYGCRCYTPRYPYTWVPRKQKKP